MIANNNGPLLTALAAAFCLAGCQQGNSDIPAATAKVPVPSFLPDAPKGFEWLPIHSMSDEFNAGELDSTKWRDHITTWQGRPPAEFLTSNVKVANGNLELKTSTHPKPNDTYSMGGSAVSGKTPATFGYFEARIKASKTKMSTTFWLHSDESDDRHKGCGKFHSTELDILETIGGWPEDNWANVMRSNTHYKPSEMVDGKCKGAPYLSKGVKYDSQNKLSADFNTYSMWWVTPNQMHFYFNGNRTGTVNLAHERDQLPFNSEMSLRMVVETYDWQPQWIPEGHAPYPNESELDDPSINTAYYDHVRSYQLQSSADNLINDAGFESSSRTDSWQLAGKRATFTDEPKMSYTQAWGVKLGAQSHAQQTVTLIDEGQYEISVYAKNISDSADTGGRLSVLSEQGKVLDSVVVSGNIFSPYTYNFSGLKGQKIILRLSGSQAGSTVFDNVAMMKVEAE
ncbi:family 16 glycosylhydrolase [Alteromonas sp. MMG017]|uniref:family 16 glycosylhydrolase n=1 Tax=Alteromonas sp. MMG017 TaxID=2822692 RepID=UPI001B3A084B|nr:family 16 glycosylhydrolase [Alteromonas sp. MMG017]MBQ4828477.1 family 16 glycosylhydrolase [Alteromonas sp. MMG017]